MSTASSSGPGESPVPGMFSLVLHSHLPWLPNHGRWPVGEEWLYQSWAASYIPVLRTLRALAAEGRDHLLTLGITPVLAAQLDDPYALSAMHHWLADWQLRSHEAALTPGKGTGATASCPAALRELGWREHRNAAAALDDFEQHWRHGGAGLVRELASNGTIELLGGPLTHTFQPLTQPALREGALRAGLADARHRFGTRPTGIWAPECAYTPGMEQLYEASGITHFMVDGPSLHGDTTLGRPVHDSSVVAFGRDLTVSYRVWSPKSGYPGHRDYRDFHTYHHGTGLKPARVTSKTTPSERKAPYDPERAAAAVQEHAADFVETVRARLIDESARIGRPAHVIAAFDTELFGHWWHEGPDWLAAVLRLMPERGITIGTLDDALAAGYVGTPARIEDSSWGSGKDWRVWAGDQVADLVQLNQEVGDLGIELLAQRMSSGSPGRDPVTDQVLREVLLCLASDWAFMVSKDSAVEYARGRAHKHAHAAREIASAALRGDEQRARELAAAWNQADGLFPALDARGFRPAPRNSSTSTEGSR
ncbi:glycoside hydrolase family 57 protein [Lolliginicoccus levis]|uniref:glycoside hydrolase family 57 protein n=1 Tax=Lolliginicoccus levis TaxID=2919542 RepID=UPI00241ED931|nr:glycoside hydrolase family 57 protein [Lolliginicoccus levis]